MAMLGYVATDLGPVELHHDGGRFTTRRTFHDGQDARRTHVSIILVTPESAREWWELCARRGVVYGEFPD